VAAYRWNVRVAWCAGLLVGFVSSTALGAGGATVVFDVRDADDRPLVSPLVAVDGQALSNGAAASPIPVAPGTHRFTFEAPALEPQTVELTLHDGDHLSERIVLVPRAQGDLSRDGNVQRMVGAGVGAAGLAAALVAVTVGIGAKNTYDSALSTMCGHVVGATDPTACSASGASQVHVSRAQAATATGLLIAAPILVVGGAVIFFTAPAAPSATGRGAGASVGSLNVRGQW
jgi:hypothetical protein